MLVAMLVNGRPAHAAIFCNMDRIGGAEAVAAQSTSARAGAKIFEALALTMKIFAEIELHFSGDRQALDRARPLVTQTIRTLNEAKDLLQAISFDRRVASDINARLQNVRRSFASVLTLANIEASDPAVQAVQAGLQKQEGAQPLLGLCVEQLDKLQKENTYMGKVYRAVAAGRPPDISVLLAAINQLNEVLRLGRLVTAVFAVAAR